MIPRSLSGSRWAQRQSAGPRIRTRAELRVEETDKASRLLRRLYWKAESLLCSWTRAREILNPAKSFAGRHSFILGDSSSGETTTREARKKHAESMFKIDFFEFYALLERYITLCLSICNVHISGQSIRISSYKTPQCHSPGLPQSVSINDVEKEANGAGCWASEHRFHANLLKALEEESCPLHNALGTQDVWIQLSLAKNYRNWWKDADADFSSSAPLEQNGLYKNKRKLEDLEIDNMLKIILAGLEDAMVVVKCRDQLVANSNRKSIAIEESTSASYEIEDEVMGDAPWEAVEDAMEWE